MVTSSSVVPTAEDSRRWVTRLMILVAAVLTAVAGGVIHAPAAAAHGGPYELTISTDGAGGLQVFAHYVEDGHVVEEIMDLVAEGVAADGTTAGPVSLESSPEGQGRWVTPEPFLAEGEWTVTVRTTSPEEVEATVDFTVEPLEPPIEPEPADAAESDDSAASDGDVAQGEVTGSEGGVGGVPTTWLVGALIAIALLGGAAWAWRSRRS